MPIKPMISDQEFLELWSKHNSAMKVAKILGISERHAHTRRRQIEGRLKVELSSQGIKAHVQKARHQAGLTDGIALVLSLIHI